MLGALAYVLPIARAEAFREGDITSTWAPLVVILPFGRRWLVAVDCWEDPWSSRAKSK